MVRASRRSCAPLWANGQRLRFVAVPSMPRVISRPSTVAADRRNDFVAHRSPSSAMFRPERNAAGRAAPVTGTRADRVAVWRTRVWTGWCGWTAR